MTKEEILFLRNMLLDRRDSVLDRVRKIAAAWQEMEERATELEEEAQKAIITRPYDQLDESGKTTIEQIDLALTKITVGDYGICESCGDDISPKRLQAIPWARLCVDCAREFERQHKTLPQTTEAIGQARIPDELQGLTNEQIVHSVYERLQNDERIDTEDLKIAFRKGILHLDGEVPGEIEREIILQILTDVMGFSAIVDRIEISEMVSEQEEYGSGSPLLGNLGDRLFYDPAGMSEDTFEAGGEKTSCGWSGSARSGQAGCRD